MISSLGAPKLSQTQTVTRQGAGRKSVSDKKDWCTPPKYVDAVHEVFNGVIHLDPCSNDYSVVDAMVEYRLPNNDGLKDSWNYPTIYVNPPYGNDAEAGTTIKHWLSKCADANEVYGSEVIALIPVATNTSHWKRFVFTKARAVCFLYDTRLRFLENGKDGGKGAPMACAMVYWGLNFQRFFDVFIEHGAVIDISNLIGMHIGSDRRILTLDLK